MNVAEAVNFAKQRAPQWAALIHIDIYFHFVSE